MTESWRKGMSHPRMQERRGRPPAADGGLAFQMTCRLTEREWDLVRAVAKTEGVKASEFVSAAILSALGPTL